MGPITIKSFLDAYHENPLDCGAFKQKFDITDVNQLLANKEYSVIIKSPSLFLTVFAKALASLEFDPNRLVFTATEKDNTLELKGDTLFSFHITETVEKIRRIFESTLYKGKVTVVPHEYKNRLFFAEPRSTAIDLSVLDPSSTCNKEDYYTFVKPSLRRLAELLGGVYSEKKEWAVYHRYQLEIDTFSIDWVAEEYYESTLKPVLIPERESLPMHFYRMYQEGKNCDLTLISCEGREIKMHRTIIDCFGGTIRNMLEANMKEANEKRIVFAETSFDVLKEFVEYLYLGAEVLRPNVFFKKKVDPCALLHLAAVYQIEPLIKCCVNLLYIGATNDQIDEVNSLAETYNIKELKDLVERLELQKLSIKLGLSLN